MAKFSKIGVLIAFLTAFFLAGCGGGKKTAAERGIEDQILLKGNITEPESLDPHIVNGIPELRVIMGLFEGLVDMDPKDLHPVPAVAKSWDIKDGGKRYIFHIRKDAKWSNGDPLTAKDFVFSYRRVLTPEMAAPYTYHFDAVVGAKDYVKGRITDFDKVGIKALNDHTLEIRLIHPVPYFLSMLPYFSWMPVHEKTILAHGRIAERGTTWTRPGNIVSNGAFRLKTWEISEKIVLEKNPHYWDAKTVRLNEFHFYPIENDKTEERAFKTGQLHITEKLPLTMVPRYKEKPELRLAQYFMTYGYVFNTNKPPFDDKRVRKAFSLALNRKALADKVAQKEEEPALSYVPPQVAGYQTTALLKEDVEEAKKMLAEAGYPDGKGFPKTTLLYNTSEIHRSVAEAMQHMWSKHLGVHIELANQEWKVYLRARTEGMFNMIRFGWVGEYLDPNAFLEIFHKDSGNNFSQWKNDEYSALIDKANKTLNQKQRYKLLDEAENMLMDELPVLPLYYYNTAYLVNPAVKNWHENILDYHPYKYLYLEKPVKDDKNQ